MGVQATRSCGSGKPSRIACSPRKVVNMQALQFQRQNVKHSRSTKPTEDPFVSEGTLWAKPSTKIGRTKSGRERKLEEDRFFTEKKTTAKEQPEYVEGELKKKGKSFFGN